MLTHHEDMLQQPRVQILRLLKNLHLAMERQKYFKLQICDPKPRHENSARYQISLEQPLPCLACVLEEDCFPLLCDVLVFPHSLILSQMYCEFLKSHFLILNCFTPWSNHHHLQAPVNSLTRTHSIFDPLVLFADAVNILSVYCVQSLHLVFYESE